MNYETVTADEFGKSLRGIGINLLTRDVRGLVSFLEDVFLAKAHQISDDFAIVTYENHVFQIHADSTYHSHPLLSLLPENGPRGGGIEIRMYGTDPDLAERRARDHVHRSTVLQTAEDKPHGLRECVLLCENGYAWIPSLPLG